MSDDIRIFKSPKYEEEAQRLLGDPIIRGMAAELPHGMGNAELESWDFMRAAEQTYRDRGGRLQLSLGGPAEAVKRAYAELHPNRRDA